MVAASANGFHFGTMLLACAAGDVTNNPGSTAAVAISRVAVRPIPRHIPLRTSADMCACRTVAFSSVSFLVGFPATFLVIVMACLSPSPSPLDRMRFVLSLFQVAEASVVNRPT